MMNILPFAAEVAIVERDPIHASLDTVVTSLLQKPLSCSLLQDSLRQTIFLLRSDSMARYLLPPLRREEELCTREPQS